MGKFRRVREGDPILAEDFNAIAEALERFANLTVADGSYLRLWDGPDGKHLAWHPPVETLALLSGSSSPYSWTEQDEAASGAFSTRGVGDSGTSNAYEINSVPNLGGKVVSLTWTAAGDWRFAYFGVGCNPADTLICPTVKSCGTGSYVVDGATVTLKDSHNVVVATGTTNSSGVVCLAVSLPGTYTVTGTGPCGTASVSQSVSCGNTYTPTIVVTGATTTITLVPECGSFSGVGTWTLTGHGVSISGNLVATGGVLGPICVPVFGDYTLTTTGSACYADVSATITVDACTDTASVNLTQKTYDLTLTITGCNGLPLSGASVSGTGTAGTGSGTTDGSGHVTISGLKAQCAFSWTASKTRLTTAGKTTTMGCGNTSDSFNLSTPTAGYQCWCGCADPVNDPLTVTDGQGTHSFFTSGGVMRTACITKSGVTVNCVAADGSCGVSYSAGVGYHYTIGCSGGTTTLGRAMPGCPTTGGGCGAGSGPVESSCGSGVETVPGTRPAACLAAGQFQGLASIGCNEFVTNSHSCSPFSVAFNFIFGFSDTATVNG